MPGIGPVVVRYKTGCCNWNGKVIAGAVEEPRAGRENEAGEVVPSLSRPASKISRLRTASAIAERGRMLPLPRTPIPQNRVASSSSPHHPWKHGWQNMKTTHFPGRGENLN